MFRAYMSALEARPLLVKTLTGAGTAMVGDVMAQKVKSGGEEPLDLQRLAAFTAFGAMWTGPVNHKWLAFLESKYPKTGGTLNLAKKVFVQQGLWSPIVYLPAFFVVNNALRGRGVDGIVEDMQERFWPTYISCLAFWIPTNTLVFARVPEPLQSVTMAGINCVWNTLLSFVANAKGGLFSLFFGPSTATEAEVAQDEQTGAFQPRRALLARANSSVCSSNIGGPRRSRASSTTSASSESSSASNASEVPVESAGPRGTGDAFVPAAEISAPAVITSPEPLLEMAAAPRRGALEELA
ncbi:Mpv17-like protein 2 [Hondaea fermentalgiana]|uniref:Mpv17-like protein 2 n=1 Tax=Hondaea fermentalgiana TaxID=2315210 RepID=A0A2R5GH25_9STRA|nr:Mpv17-like protein 2 [Hondaea fermentalgiana]|eukprot:GBG30206.1 Mpv17-like protein 2 [Hondaea fermentalgiana]